jgi:hypothetical protein
MKKNQKGSRGAGGQGRLQLSPPAFLAPLLPCHLQLEVINATQQTEVLQ